MNLGEYLDTAIKWLEANLPSLKWIALAYVAGLLTTAIIK